MDQDIQSPAVDGWVSFGFEPVMLDPIMNYTELSPDGHRLGCRVPKGIIVFTSLKANAKDVGAALEGLPPQAMFPLTVGQRNFFCFRVEDNAGRFDGSTLTETVRLLQAGDLMPLPTIPDNNGIGSLADMTVIPAQEVQRALAPKGDAEIINSPLASFSLRGRAAEFESSAAETKPLLGDLCLSGQATIWYAPPNAGKTLVGLKLVIDAVAERRINPGNIYYVNADDSSSGFATKMRLMDDLGVHTLSPGLKGLHAENLINLLGEVATQDKARGSLIILDTVKKFVSLMDKGKASAFTQACRQVVMRGGSILGLAHTAKIPASNGKLRYAGTTDMVDDFDAAYIIAPMAAEGMKGEKTVLFEAIKRRGDNAERVAYAYAGEGGISYEERLASVRLVDPDEVNDFQRIETQRDDADVIAAVLACIGDGVTAKMALARAAAARAKVSQRAAIRLIETYTGNDPSLHYWTYAVQQRGAKIFGLLPKAENDAAPEDVLLVS